MAYSYFFLIFWIEHPFVINVNNKFYNRNLVSGLSYCSINISRTFHYMYKLYRGSRIGKEKHEKGKAGGARRLEWATDHFRSSFAVENTLLP